MSSYKAKWTCPESTFTRSGIGLVARGFTAWHLLLSPTDRHWAKLLNGRDVTVSGIVIGAEDLDAILPERDGEINGRFWGGTNCQGALVIFVKRFGR